MSVTNTLVNRFVTQGTHSAYFRYQQITVFDSERKIKILHLKNYISQLAVCSQEIISKNNEVISEFYIWWFETHSNLEGKVTHLKSNNYNKC